MVFMEYQINCLDKDLEPGICYHVIWYSPAMILLVVGTVTDRRDWLVCQRGCNSGRIITHFRNYCIHAICDVESIVLARLCMNPCTVGCWVRIND